LIVVAYRQLWSWLFHLSPRAPIPCHGSSMQVEQAPLPNSTRP
jgi:hypothetical protein